MRELRQLLHYIIHLLKARSRLAKETNFDQSKFAKLLSRLELRSKRSRELSFVRAAGTDSRWFLDRFNLTKEAS